MEMPKNTNELWPFQRPLSNIWPFHGTKINDNFLSFSLGLKSYQNMSKVSPTLPSNKFALSWLWNIFPLSLETLENSFEFDIWNAGIKLIQSNFC